MLGLTVLWTLLSSTCALHGDGGGGGSGGGGRNADKSFMPMSLADPQTLHFTANTLTQGHHPVQQLSCVGGNAASLYRLHNLTCTSLGPIKSLGHDEVHWKCTSSVPEEFTLGETTVRCESIPQPPPPPSSSSSGEGEEVQSPSDGGFVEYVVEGSCAVEYTIHLSDVGEERVGKDLPQSPATDLPPTSPSSRGLAETLFWVLFAGVATFIGYSVFLNPSTGSARPNRVGPSSTGNNNNGGAGGGGGGYSGGDDDDDDGAGRGSSGQSPDWTPISPHSTLYTPPSSGLSRSTLERPAVSARTDSSIAPPIIGDNANYGPVREVTSFGGTTTR